MFKRTKAPAADAPQPLFPEHVEKAILSQLSLNEITARDAFYRERVVSDKGEVECAHGGVVMYRTVDGYPKRDAIERLGIWLASRMPSLPRRKR